MNDNRATWHADPDSDPCDEWLAIEKSSGVLYVTVQKLWTPLLLKSDPHDRCDKWVTLVDDGLLHREKADKVE